MSYGILMTAGAGLLAGLNGTASYIVLTSGLAALQLTLLRTVCAFVLLLGICLVAGSRRLRITKAQLVAIAPLAMTGFFGVPILYLIAVSRIPVGVAVLLEYLAPVLVALWARYGQHRAVHWRLWIGLALCVVGLAGVTGVTYSAHINLAGVTAGLGAAILLSVFYVLGERAAGLRDPLSLTCWSYGLAAFASAAVQPWWHFPFRTFDLDSHGFPVWSVCLVIVVLGTVAPYLLLLNALRFLSATSVVTIGLCEPIAAAVCAWIFLNETLSSEQIWGGVLVLAGIATAESASVGRT